MTDDLPDERQAICSECGRLFNVDTGLIVCGWEGAKFVSKGDFLCAPCKDTLILQMSKAIPAKKWRGNDA